MARVEVAHGLDKLPVSKMRLDMIRTALEQLFAS